MTKQPTNNEASTSLTNKHSEPLIIRKYQYPYGFPVYVALICGSDLSNLDELHGEYVKQYWTSEKKSIQNLRNYFGNMNKYFLDKYKEKIEGVAVIAFADKLVISSLWGDFMTHLQCRLELYSLLNMTTNV